MKRIVLLLSLYAILPAFATQMEIVEIDTQAFPEVSLAVRIWAEHGKSPDELSSRLNLYEDGVELPISEIDVTPESVSTGILLLIDTSGSMAGGPLQEAIELSQQVVSLAPPDVQFGLARFDDQYTDVLPLPAGRAALRDALDALDTRGHHTVLRDAIYAALRRLRAAEVSTRRILLLSDGKDEQSALQLGDILPGIEAGQIQMIAVQVGVEKGGDLERLADLTGGIYRQASQITSEELMQWTHPTQVERLDLRYRSPVKGLHRRTVELSLDGSVRSLVTYEPPPSSPYPSRWFFWPAGLLVGGGIILLLFRRRTRPAGTVPLSTHPGETSQPAVAQLEVRSEDGQTRIIPIGPRVLVGRAPTNDVVLPDDSVSKQHMRIAFQDGIFRLYDLGSTNGVLVNGERVNQCPLYEGDRIQLGRVELIFRLPASTDG